MSGPESYDVVLFDPGGVLIELGGPPVVGHSSRDPMDEDVWRLWLQSPSVRRFETGRATPEEFGRAMVDEFDLAIGPDVFLQAFRDWPKGFFPGAEELLKRLAESVRVACLSNSNDLHWTRFHRELRFAELFHHRFASHLIGSLKPDREVFEHVVAELGCEPGRVLFFDDNRMCVDGAREAGLDGCRVQGPGGAAEVLVERGLLARDAAVARALCASLSRP